MDKKNSLSSLLCDMLGRHRYLSLLETPADTIVIDDNDKDGCRFLLLLLLLLRDDLMFVLNMVTNIT